MKKNFVSVIDRENDILIAATRIFAKKDYHQVTMDEIARELKVGKGTLYRYYHSKEELYFSIINRGLEALYNYLKRETDKEEDILSKIKKLIYCNLRFFEKNKPFVKLFFQEEIKFKSKGMMQCKNSLEKNVKLVEKLIWDGQLQGVIKVVDVSLCANLLVGMMKQMFLKLTEEEEENLNIASVTDLIYDAFLNGFQAKRNNTRTEKEEV